MADGKSRWTDRMYQYLFPAGYKPTPGTRPTDGTYLKYVQGGSEPNDTLSWVSINADIESYLESQGFDPSTLTFTNDTVNFVNGDLIIEDDPFSTDNWAQIRSAYGALILRINNSDGQTYLTSNAYHSSGSATEFTTTNIGSNTDDHLRLAISAVDGGFFFQHQTAQTSVFSTWTTLARLTTTGLGIGTAPSAPLHIFNSSSPHLIFDTDDTTTPINYISWRENNSEVGYVGYGSSSNDHFYMLNSLGNVLLQPTSGNVGIGVTSVDAKLHVVSADTSPTIKLEDTLVSGYVGIDFFDSTDTHQASVVHSNDSASWLPGHFWIGTRQSGTDLVFISGGLNERMRILDTGDIGINDSTPSYKLDVNGTGRYVGRLNADAGITIGSGQSIDFNTGAILDYNTTTDTGTTVIITAGNSIRKSSSSMRYKEKIEDWDFDTSLFYQIQPRKWTWRNIDTVGENIRGKISYGGIAEEFFDVYGKDGVHFNDKKQIESLNWHFLAMATVDAVHFQNNKISNLEKRIMELESLIN